MLDLDETLVHSQFKKPEHCDLQLTVHLNQQEILVFVQIRPGYQQFMKLLAPHYEIVVYTASLRQYADPLLDLIDPEGLCTARLYREHCTLVGNCHVKDLQNLGREMSDVLIIDNSPYSYRLDHPNAVPITSWYDDLSDVELLNMIPFLEQLS